MQSAARTKPEYAAQMKPDLTKRLDTHPRCGHKATVAVLRLLRATNLAVSAL